MATSDRILISVRSRMRTPRGVGCSIATVFVILLSTASSKTPASTFAGLVIISPLIWAGAWFFLKMSANVWETLVEGSPPAVKVGRAWQPGGNTRPQLREDGNARVFADRGGILLRQRYWFIASGTPPIEIPGAGWTIMAAAQPEDPQCIASWNGRTYWCYQDRFYWTNAGYASEDVKALLFTKEREHQRRLEHAHAVLAAAESPAASKREPIPRDVKRTVWERDEGRCVECASTFELQYDHIIPFSMGGASTVENLQLLCARCNQAKGGRL